jgi:hypothetical protein
VKLSRIAVLLAAAVVVLAPVQPAVAASAQAGWDDAVDVAPAIFEDPFGFAPAIFVDKWEAAPAIFADPLGLVIIG